MKHSLRTRRGLAHGLARIARLALALLFPFAGLNLDAATPAPDILAAVRTGHVAQVEQALKDGSCVNARDAWGRTPLLMATQMRHTAVVRLLLGMKPDVNAANRNDITPLIAAAQTGNAEAVEMLLAAGAAPDPGDNLGWTALMWASSRNRGAIAKMLLDAGADASIVGRDEATALDLARRVGADATLVALLEAKAGASAPRAAALAPKPAATMPPKVVNPALDPERIVRGPANAPVTIVEFTDLQCPYCAYGAKVMDEVLARYDGRVRLVVKHLPLPALHPMATACALYFEAIALQDAGKAWAFYDRVFHAQPALSGGEAYLRRVASEAGTDLARLDADMQSGVPAIRVAADVKESRALRFDGVPVFLVNGVVIEGAQPAQAFVDVIESLPR